MQAPSDLKFTSSHEWLRLDADGLCSVGITDHAQEQLGDLVFYEAPQLGRAVQAGAECAVLESVKAAADIYAPVTGEIVAVNDAVTSSPELINQDPYGAWLFRILFNAFYSRYRKRIAHPPPETLDDESGLPVQAAPFVVAVEMNQALSELNVEYRTVLLLAVVEGFTCQEISRILDIPMGTVMSRLSRARNALRSQLAPRPQYSKGSAT